MNLGQLLRQSIEQDAANTAAAAKARAERESAQAAEDFACVERFFRDAREDFTRKISAGGFGPKVAIKVGYRENSKVRQLLDLSCVTGAGALAKVRGNSRFSALWADFEKWAADNGLAAYWTDEHDGGGQETWYMLRVKPV